MLGMTLFRHEFKVDLDRDRLPFEPQIMQQLGDRRALLDLAGLTVDRKLHDADVTVHGMRVILSAAKNLVRDTRPAEILRCAQNDGVFSAYERLRPLLFSRMD
jgi:hypothetical protein